jgi:ABC-type dipeptide/oligopeptide/nickel transport system permease subunit
MQMRRIDPWFAIGLFAFFTLLFVALFGERIAPYEATYMVVDPPRLRPPYAPGEVYPLGSDALGRDLISVVLAGARATLIIATIAGAARVLLGLIFAIAAGWWRPMRLVADSLAEIVSAVPATLVALLVVLVFVRGDPQIFTFVGALLLTGWAGPYRIVRAEQDRLLGSQFSESALALGVRRLPLFARHHLPHLIPVLAVSTAQQSVASLVAVAELGVLGYTIGATRQLYGAFISTIPEWGGILANSRSLENLWTTRWVILVPGVAFALAAMSISAIGLGIARQYQRRNAFYDLRSRGAAAIALLCAVGVIAMVLVPERYAAARDWADAARERVTIGAPVEQVFSEAGLRPIGPRYVVERQITRLAQTGPASLAVPGAGQLSEEGDGPTDFLPVLYFASGGGTFDAPIVFAGWGISPSDHPAVATQTFSGPSFGKVVEEWPDDYQAVDVRGKIAVIFKTPNIKSGSRNSTVTQDFETAVANALKRGARAVLYVDPLLPVLPLTSTNVARINPYKRLGESTPIERPDRPPVIVLSLSAAERMLGPLGVSPKGIWDRLGHVGVVGTSVGQTGIVQSDDPIFQHTLARELGVTAHLELPVERVTATPRSLVGATGDAPRILVWAVTPATRLSSRPALDAVASAIRTLAHRSGEEVAFVVFDRTGDPLGNARQIADLLGRTSWDLIIVLDDLEGDRLRFNTLSSDLIPAFDEYAQRSGARAQLTRGSSGDDFTWPGIQAFPKSRSVVVSGAGDAGDLRADAAALLGNIAGRDALGAPELRR